ncbi:acyltransferase family protein [Pseudoduganella namucuonensis]|uniref:Peptidoglycan/LPS O-acetylase OafA/YrhL, contains acyltransferase and SGNH-hydrolase domains n=1 Tax=Pseudoduganella namucuonensis TaxID=1035707 RepID=A0A1I7FRT2_9BURK|nr:acyltransferase [Pseudoduganella namucuonensis]SFU38865.1 Peptidoglycan/LPS O-acetylase OafA/YrhL, contains acyltransferase and SGNH-hydrolase domains [Pseudoduganella namucuonensis]
MKSLNLPYNARIDQLRWLAATIVFLFHYYLAYREQGGAPLASNWFGLVTEGHTGVGLFFALSGFLFMQIARHQHQISYRDFMRNRCLRILPLFLTIFMLATAIGRDKFAPQDILYLLSTNLGLAPTSYTPVTGAAWSISVEFTFYLVFPFLARFTLEQGPRYLLKLLALMVFFKLAAFHVNEKSTLMYFSTLVGRFDQFLIGMLAALLYARHADALRRHAAWLAPLALLLAVFNSALQSKYGKFDPSSHSVFWIWWSMLEAAGWSCVIMAWVAFDKRLPAWLERALDHGGKISFSFYLLHMAMIHLLARFVGLPALTGDRALDALLCFPVVYGATWAVSALSYSAIEEPFLRLRRSYGAAKPGVQLVSDAA